MIRQKNENSGKPSHHFASFLPARLQRNFPSKPEENYIQFKPLPDLLFQRVMPETSGSFQLSSFLLELCFQMSPCPARWLSCKPPPALLGAQQLTDLAFKHKRQKGRDETSWSERKGCTRRQRRGKDRKDRVSVETASCSKMCCTKSILTLSLQYKESFLLVVSKKDLFLCSSITKSKQNWYEIKMLAPQGKKQSQIAGLLRKASQSLLL